MTHPPDVNIHLLRPENSGEPVIPGKTGNSGEKVNLMLALIFNRKKHGDLRTNYAISAHFVAVPPGGMGIFRALYVDAKALGVALTSDGFMTVFSSTNLPHGPR